MYSSKACFKCGKTLPLTEFYKHPAMGDGHLGKCKECTKKDVHEHRLKNIEKVREYDKMRAKKPHRKALAKRVSNYPHNKAVKLELDRAWRNADKRRMKCHNALRRAVLKGVVTRMPCEVCGNEKSHAHHEDYDFPLLVVWLCSQHHKDRHKQLKMEC